LILLQSGTVGNPKAAMLSHDNFTWDAEAITEYMQVGKANEVLVSFLPLSHVAAQVMALFLVQHPNTFTCYILLC
jgi:long-chain-fatty-acid--CoA ligase ACSBG